MYYQFTREQKIKASIKDVWEFASTPKNLQKITPEYMLFEITSNNFNDIIYPGMIISYVVAPVFNFKIKWVTEITQVKEHKFFVDEQRLGPYKLWHHQHFFEEKDDCVLMKDIITYTPPFGLLGWFANKLFIKRKLNEIFDYRFNSINNIFK